MYENSVVQISATSRINWSRCKSENMFVLLYICCVCAYAQVLIRAIGWRSGHLRRHDRDASFDENFKEVPIKSHSTSPVSPGMLRIDLLVQKDTCFGGPI